MARRSEHSLEEIKSMVMNAAETIVVEEGFSSLKVRKIALEIGYTVGSIYMVFDNMADLIMHVKARTLDALTERLNQVTPQINREQTLVELGLAYLDFASNNFNRWSMIFEHRLPADVEIPKWYTGKIDGVFSPIEKQLTLLASDRTETQIKSAAWTLWSGVHGVCILSLTGRSDSAEISETEKNVVLLIENFLRGWQLS